MDAFKANVKRLFKEYPDRHDQALAIAYSVLKRACGVDPKNKKRLTPSEIIALSKKRRRRRAHDHIETIDVEPLKSAQRSYLSSLADQLVGVLYNNAALKVIVDGKFAFAEGQKVELENEVKSGQYLIVFNNQKDKERFICGEWRQPKSIEFWG